MRIGDIDVRLYEGHLGWWFEVEAAGDGAVHEGPSFSTPMAALEAAKPVVDDIVSGWADR